MSVLSIIRGVVTLVPRVIRAFKDSSKKELDQPLGESDAARVLRMEEERRAAERARKRMGDP
jgi:hypothetical protein